MVEEINEGKFTVEEDTISEDNRSGIFQFNGCQNVAVYIKSGNAIGNKVKDSGHIAPQVIRMSYFIFCCEFRRSFRSDHGGTVIVPSNDRLPTYINEGAPSSLKSKVSSTQASNHDTEYQAALGQSYRCQGIPPSSMISPPLMKEDSSSVAQSGPPSAPPVGLPSRSRQNNPFLKQYMVAPPGDIPHQRIKEGQTSISPRKRDKLPATTDKTPMQVNHATIDQYTPNLPGK